ncbi:polyprenyl synthetase family protein [Paenibacillus sp. SYP-B4298]|uniref:polyprenyl synthetase family protein n=1 Tax=Paenibacillus sp. SYP-B4298 TaxID=2996034 RepID=UPI0022DD191C|nr:polyprenyl synthetase family protein [Paenibacillus sp. SYP-B4298]
MNEDYHIDPDPCYEQAAHKAGQYFAILLKLAESGGYASVLTEHLRQWQHKHIRRFPWLSLFSRPPQEQGGNSGHYINWLERTGRLDGYLERSVSYMYMRDLGQAVDDPKTQKRIRGMSARVKQRLLSTQSGGLDMLNMAGIYRWAQSEGVESAAMWLISKLHTVAAHIPEQMNAEHAQRKLIKIVFGVVLHAMEEMEEGLEPRERAERISQAIRLGYSYGLTYPFIDDLLDAKVLNVEEKARYSRLIRAALLRGTVPELELENWSDSNRQLVHYVHGELREAFEYIKEQQPAGKRTVFFEQSYVFFHSQELDRVKSLSNPGYTNEELFIPVILKSASSRLVARSVLGTVEEEGFESRTFYYGIYNQLADDFADLDADLEDGAVTPYTYYLTHHDRRPDLLNPFELYWTVVCHLIQHVYKGDTGAREVILDRAINGLKRFKARLGDTAYARRMRLLAPDAPAFNRLVQRMVRRADDVEFLDKLLRDQLAGQLKQDRQHQQLFHETVRKARDQINRMLPLDRPADLPHLEEPLTMAANYSLASGGKRLRPVLTWVVGVQEYGLAAEQLTPLLRSLEYMHTASLIFDDLPTQDNASIRRGQATLHLVHDSATAELTGLLLMQRAVQEQASLQSFDPGAVLALMKYSAQRAEDLCRGQAMDLGSKGKRLTLEQLNTLCYYKTGIAFEAALIMPALLAKASSQQLDALKSYAYHAGIAFQIKDDLLDTEGDGAMLGKPVGQDASNDRSTFVTVLGLDGARRQMWEHYCQAMEALRRFPQRSGFLTQALHYMVHRES